MTKVITYVHKRSAQILLWVAVGYVAWIGIEINALGKDVAFLKANDRHLEFRLTAVEKRLDSVEAQLVSIAASVGRIEQYMLSSQGGRGGGAATP